MKILQLKSENVKRLNAVEITPDGSMGAFDKLGKLLDEFAMNDETHGDLSGERAYELADAMLKARSQC